MKGKDIILGLLQTRGALTGYRINEILQTQLNHFYGGSYGMIYPTLKRLEKNGLVEKNKVSQEDKPNKNVFSILPEGKKEFLKDLSLPLVEDEFKSDFLMKMYFGKELSDDEIIQLIKNELEMKKEKLKLLNDNLTNWKDNGMNDYQKLTFDYGIIYYSSTIELLEKKLKELQDKS